MILKEDEYMIKNKAQWEMEDGYEELRKVVEERREVEEMLITEKEN